MKQPTKKPFILLSLIGVIALTSACSQTTTRPYEGVDYRFDRAQQISAHKTFEDCNQEALDLDESARTTMSPAKYIQSARVADRCISELGEHSDSLNDLEKMQVHALSIQNYFKGGDIDRSRQQLQGFESVYGNKDLYYPDRSSFIDTYRLLLGDVSGNAAARHSLLNAKAELKSEVRRNQYWKTH